MKTNFKPITLAITLETETELKGLYYLFNLSEKTIKSQYHPQNKKVYKIIEKNMVNYFDIWNSINTEIINNFEKIKRDDYGKI